MKTVKPDDRREASRGHATRGAGDSGTSPPGSATVATASIKVVPTVYPTSPPIEKCVDSFWETGESFESVVVTIHPPERPLAVLEDLGPSPFPRGSFPLVGFLATTYDKVSRYALERR